MADDKYLALALIGATRVGDEDTVVEITNDVCSLLALPLDETERGLTEWAWQQIDAWVSATLGSQFAGEVRA